MSRKGLYGAVPLSHFFLSSCVKNGDTVVDATCGNGADTEFLARLVGEEGRVWALDVQEAALREAERRLRDAGLIRRVSLVLAGHERMADYAPEGLGAVVFNLGFLPGAGSDVLTSAVSTVPALNAAVQLLRPGGVVTIAVYTGHAGGDGEAEAVAAWGAQLPPALFNVWQSRQLNRSPAAPYVIVVEKG